jgi:3-methyladenine DNA glycosylase/8-oxoguanine DNA glycosylase
MLAEPDRQAEPPREHLYRPPTPVDAQATLSQLRHGLGDPTIRFDGSTIWRATRTPEGAATTRIDPLGDGYRVTAWGPGAAFAIDSIPRLLGELDRPEEFKAPGHPLLRELHRRARGMRFGRTDAVIEALLPAVIEQKVTGIEARASYRALIYRYGERAPGPRGLWLAPTVERLRTIPYFDFHPLGMEQRRAVVIRRAAEHARALEAAGSLAPADALTRLQAIPGVGVWTAAETARAAFGDPDAVSVGDYHVPNMVCWALAREPRGTDERMLELLEPYRGHRARVVRLLERAGIAAPKFGPRMTIRSIAEL